MLNENFYRLTNVNDSLSIIGVSCTTTGGASALSLPPTTILQKPRCYGNSEYNWIITNEAELSITQPPFHFEKCEGRPSSRLLTTTNSTCSSGHRPLVCLSNDLLISLLFNNGLLSFL